MATDLGQMQVRIMVSDPWDWGSQFGCGPFFAQALKWEQSDDGRATSMLLRLSEPRTFEDVDCEYFIARPRHENSRLEGIARGQEVECGMTRITEEQVNSDKPFDLSRWRGGVGLIGSVRVVAENHDRRKAASI